MVMPPPPDNILVGFHAEIDASTGELLSFVEEWAPRPKPDLRILHAGPTAAFLVWDGP